MKNELRARSVSRIWAGRRLLVGLWAGVWLMPCCILAAQSVVTRVEVVPAEVILRAGSGRQQLTVTGYDAQGNARDLTRTARYKVEPARVADVTADGLVTSKGEGQGVVSVAAGGFGTRTSLQVEIARGEKPSYRLDVVPLLSKGGCNMGACHGNLNGKGGFRLSLRGEDATFDLASLTREALGRRVDPACPDASLIVRKPTGGLPHEGGVRFSINSPEAAALLGWIAGGARDDLDSAPRLVRLDAFPTSRVNVAPGLTQQLVVTATFADGSTRDVTRQASYDVSDPTRAAVSTTGLVTATRPTETAVAVRYLEGRAVSRVAFLHDRPGYVWNGPGPRNAVDTHVFGRLKLLEINPSPPINDAVFLRRASLDALGRLPSPNEAKAFLASNDPDKRDKLIDRLLTRPEFADFWALKWADLLRNEEKTMGEKGVWVFQRWLRDQFAADLPMTAFARKLLTARGSSWSNPAANFYRTNRDPMTAAETVSQVFLGVRLQCARCHNHPFDVWTQNDYYGLAAYFGNVQHKEMNVRRADKLDKHDINGDEMIYLSGRPETVQPRSGAMMAPKPPSGPRPDLGADLDARDELARWLTENNRQFARNLANRVWFHLTGRGVVEPVDDFRESNPPSNPELLEALTDAFEMGGYRLKPLVALVMKSRTYQLGAGTNDTNADDESNFSHASVRLLPAEVLLDAISSALGEPGTFKAGPRGANAGQLAGTAMGGPFLKVFGKPDRLLTCECERSDSTTLAQAFQLINGQVVRDLLEAHGNRIGRLIRSGTQDDAILDELTLAALGREATSTERTGFLGHVRDAKDRRKAWEDMAWAMMNSKGFLLRH